MTVKDIELIAAGGGEVPDGLELPEQLLLITLRELYKNFRSGGVNRERGKREKQRIIVAYEALKSNYGVIDHHQAIRRRLQQNVGNLHDCGCPTCRKVMRVFDGIDRQDLPENVEEVNALNDKLREMVKERSERAAELRTTLDKVRWVLDKNTPAETMVKEIGEIVKNNP